MEAVTVTEKQNDVQLVLEEDHGAGAAALLETAKTVVRLVPRQINDEISLAKLELEHKKDRIGGVVVFAAVALIFGALLVVGLVVAAIAGLATIMPLWLSALVICAALLLVLAISGLVAFKKFQKLLPLLPPQANRGIRHDLGIIKEGRAFDPSTLETKPMSREEKKARKAQETQDKMKAAAERAAKEAEQGPKPTEEELVKRTAARRDHLLNLREEILVEADVKKLAVHAVDAAKDKARHTVGQAAAGAANEFTDTVKDRWKPATVFAVSTATMVVLLRKLFQK